MVKLVLLTAKQILVMQMTKLQGLVDLSYNNSIILTTCILFCSVVCERKEYDTDPKRISPVLSRRCTDAKTFVRLPYIVSYCFSNLQLVVWYKFNHIYFSIRSLSYIFLISYNQRCVLSKMSQLYKTNIIRALDIKKHLRFMEDDVILACRRIQMMLYDDLIDEDVVEEKIDSIKSSSNSQNVKAVAKLLSSVLRQFTVEKSEQKHETSLIIESLRPFIFSCVISRIKDIKFEWQV